MVYTGKQAVIDDPGCCNYDDPRFRSCKLGEFHSSLLVDGVPDAHNFSIYGFDRWPEIFGQDWTDDRIATAETSNQPEWQGVRWIRQLDCADSALTVTDVVTGEKKHEYTFLFVLAPDVTLELISAAELILTAGTEKLRLSFSADAAVYVEPAVNFQTGPSRETLRIVVKLKRCARAEIVTRMECL